jgi:hypothetical protein
MAVHRITGNAQNGIVARETVANRPLLTSPGARGSLEFFDPTLAEFQEEPRGITACLIVIPGISLNLSADIRRFA